MFTHGKKVSAIPIKQEKVVVEEPKVKEEVKKNVGPVQVKRPPDAELPKPVTQPMKGEKPGKKKTLLEELLEGEDLD